MPPTNIAGRYTVERAIGQGGMGTVWLCRDEVLGRQVAVKQVGTMPGETTSDVNRALREARSSAALNHRNVVAVYDAIEDGDHNWLVMEYVPSRTLAEILATEGWISPERAAWIGAQAADGLAAAHARGTVHRDVKPANILVTDDDLVKIMDFGISRTHGDAQLTQTGLVTGTPAYFSPEASRGESTGPAIDVWALGATLFVAVEGHALYPAKDNALAMLTAIATEPAPLPQQAGPLTDAITRMLDRDASTRWSMQDAAHALHRLGRRRSAAAGPPTVTLAAPVIDSTPTPPAQQLAQPLAQPAGPLRPDDADDRSRPGWLVGVAAVLAVVLLAAGGYTMFARGDAADDPTVTTAPTATPSSGAPTTRGRKNPPASDPPASDPPTSAPPTSAPTTPDPSTPAPLTPEVAPIASTDTTSTVADYYALLPSDTRSAYSVLSDAYRSRTSYGDYEGFWRTIDAVSVDGVVESGSETVDATLTYTSADGGVESETRRLFLVESDDGFRIDGDEVVG